MGSLWLLLALESDQSGDCFIESHFSLITGTLDRRQGDFNVSMRTLQLSLVFRLDRWVLDRIQQTSLRTPGVVETRSFLLQLVTTVPDRLEDRPLARFRAPVNIFNWIQIDNQNWPLDDPIWTKLGRLASVYLVHSKNTDLASVQHNSSIHWLKSSNLSELWHPITVESLKATGSDPTAMFGAFTTFTSKLKRPTWLHRPITT